MDSNGIIRLIKQGFSVEKEEHVQAIEQLIRNEVEKVELKDEYYSTGQERSHLEIELANTKFKLGMEYTKQGNKEAALRELDGALALDPDNFLIRKQRWYIRFPEKFSPTIDIEWQQQQLETERTEEENCGPEGCIIPGTNVTTKEI